MKIHNATPVVSNNLQKQGKKIAFNGILSGAKNTFLDLFYLNRQGPMNRNLFTLNAFVFLLGTRLITSRDKDEKREIFIRDVPSIIIAVFGVPVIGKFAAKLLQKKTGFAIMENPKDGVVSGKQLESWYKYDENIKPGLSGFSKRLADFGNGVSLKKIYSSLSSNIETSLSSFSENNDSFIKELTSDKNTSIAESIKKCLSNADNAALKKASHLSTYTKAIGFGATLALLGIFIPKLNIYITEKVNKNRKTKAQNDLKTKETQETQNVSKLSNMVKIS